MLPVSCCWGGSASRRHLPLQNATFLSSKAQTYQRCQAVWPAFTWDVPTAGTHGNTALARCRQVAPALVGCSAADATGLGGAKIHKTVSEAIVSQWRAKASPADIGRLNAFAGPLAAKLLEVLPSKALDTNLLPDEFAATVATRLGVDVMDGTSFCCFCAHPMDSTGIHPLSCMGGGDTAALHTVVRNTILDYCLKGRLKAVPEKAKLLEDVVPTEANRRPADILVLSAGWLAPMRPDGNRSYRSEPVALDFAIVNALGAGHWKTTFLNGGGSAAEEYGRHKRKFKDTEVNCAKAGVQFQPVVFEAQGSVPRETQEVVKAIAEAVGRVELRDSGKVTNEIYHRIAVAIARANARAIGRRIRTAGAGNLHASGGAGLSAPVWDAT